MIFKYLLIFLSAININKRERCTINSRSHFGQPLPVVIRDGRLLEPNDGSGNVHMEYGDTLTLSCEGEGSIYHPNRIRDEATASISCVGGDNFINDQWLSAPSSFSSFRCPNPPRYTNRQTNRSCFEGNSIYEVGYQVQDEFYPLYESCFNGRTLSPVYSKYTQRPYNAMYQTRVERPFFVAEHVYGLVPVDFLLSPKGLKAAVTQRVGSMADDYINDSNFISRGHLAAKTDFVFAFGERASFHYVNCAPQWYGFNSGNWNTLEVDLRNYIHQAGLDTVVYTGTFGVTQLLNRHGQRMDIYLDIDENNNPIIPVPLYYYKVVYEPERKRGIAFVGINGPYYSVTEARNLFFCEDICRKNLSLRWLTWHPDNSREGYSFCCSVPDFRNTVQHLPEFEVTDILI